MAKKILIQGGRVINPKTNLDSTMDVLISGSEIESVAPKIQRTKDYTLIDASNYLISPGFIDIHCHLREPGEEYKETIITGITIYSDKYIIKISTNKYDITIFISV